MMMRALLALLLLAGPAVAQSNLTPTYNSTTILTDPANANQAVRRSYLDSRISLALPSIAPCVLYGGTGGAGVAQGVTVSTGLSCSGNVLSLGAVPLANLAQGGATSAQVLAWNGTVWAPATASGSSYTLPIATGSVLGGIKSSATIAIAGDGTASLAQNGATSGQVPQWNGTAWIPATVSSGGSSYVLPSATSSVLGGVTVSTGLSVTSGALSVAYGTTAGTAAQGNDTRIVGAAQAASLATVATSGAYADLTGKPTIPVAGTTSGTYAAGNDSRLSPFGSSAPGIVPASGGGTSTYLRADGTWATPSGGSGSPGSTPRVIASGTTATLATADYYTAVNQATPAAITITLPASPTAGQPYTVSDFAGVANGYPITLAPNTSQSIVGSATINTSRGARTLIYFPTLNAWQVAS